MELIQIELTMLHQTSKSVSCKHKSLYIYFWKLYFSCWFFFFQGKQQLGDLISKEVTFGFKVFFPTN